MLDQVAPYHSMRRSSSTETRSLGVPVWLTALLALAQSRAERRFSTCPRRRTSAATVAHGFFKHAAELYELQGRVKSTKATETSVLLEVTSISKSATPRRGRQDPQRAQEALVKNLNLDARSRCVSRLRSRKSVRTSGAAGRGGWFAVQTYTWRSGSAAGRW